MRKPHFELVSVHVEFIRLDCTLSEERIRDIQGDAYLLWSDDPQTCLTLTPAGDYRVTGDLAVVQVTPLPDPASYYPNGEGCLSIEFEHRGQEMFADDLDEFIRIARRQRDEFPNDVVFYGVYEAAEYRSGDGGDVDIEYTFAGELPMDRLLTIVRPNLNRDAVVVKRHAMTTTDEKGTVLAKRATEIEIHRDGKSRIYKASSPSQARLYELIGHSAWDRSFNINTATGTYTYTHIPANVADYIQLLQDRITAAHKLVSLHKDAIRVYLDDPSLNRLNMLSQIVGESDMSYLEYLTKKIDIAAYGLGLPYGVKDGQLHPLIDANLSETPIVKDFKIIRDALASQEVSS